MPSLHKITVFINDTIKANLTKKPFKGSIYKGITEAVVDDVDGNSKPCIVDNDGQATSVIINDVYPMQIYHKTISIRYNEAENNYGKPGNTTEEEANMQLVFIGNRNKLNLTKENIIALLAVFFPKNVKTTDVSSPDFLSCSISIGTAELNTRTVYNNEYGNIDFNLPPNYVMMSLPYTVVTSYNKSCIVVC